VAAPDDAPSTISMLPGEQSLLDLTNSDRVANGLPQLAFDPDALPIARARASSQLGTDRLTHYDQDSQLAFARMLSDASLEYQLAGENLARSSLNYDGLIKSIELALMNSPTHRSNILEPKFTKVAIGAALDPSGQIAFAEIFRSAE